LVQILLWLLFLPPWLLLIPLDKKRVKHFLSVTFFTLVLTSIAWQTAQVYNWWTTKNNLFFLTNISSFNYGFLAITTLYLFYFTYHSPWLFFGANILLDAFQAFIISPFVFEKIGFYKMNTMNDFGLFLLLISMVPIIYVYQRLYDGSKETNRT
jgi:hypothetical protein